MRKIFVDGGDRGHKDLRPSFQPLYRLMPWCRSARRIFCTGQSPGLRPDPTHLPADVWILWHPGGRRASIAHTGHKASCYARVCVCSPDPRMQVRMPGNFQHTPNIRRIYYLPGNRTCLYSIEWYVPYWQFLVISYWLQVGSVWKFEIRNSKQILNSNFSMIKTIGDSVTSTLDYLRSPAIPAHSSSSPNSLIFFLVGIPSFRSQPLSA